MTETIVQELIELKFGSRTATIMNGKRVFQIEEPVKINEKGDRACLNLTIPAELAKTKKIKLKITTEGVQKLENDFQNIGRTEITKIGKRTRESQTYMK